MSVRWLANGVRIYSTYLGTWQNPSQTVNKQSKVDSRYVTHNDIKQVDT